MAQKIDTFPSFLGQDSTTVAQKLLGCYLVRELDGQEVRVVITETESYDQSDAASHSYKGRTPRVDVMFGGSGHLYVYFTYGMHYCCNIVTGEENEGAAVLIRSVMPVDGIEVIESRRGKTGPVATNGPAKICQALGIDMKLNGHDLRRSPLQLLTGPTIEPDDIVVTKRIGISKERDALRRFYLRDSSYVSVK